MRRVQRPNLALALFAFTAGSPAGAEELNDTGQTLCSDGTEIGLPCGSVASGTDLLPGQDAEHGRDVDVNNPDDGLAGFSFTKLDAQGVPLADQRSDFATEPWPCVLDQVTGLFWEVKNDDAGLRDRDWTYSWFDDSGSGTGGFDGSENGGNCVDTLNCDTEKFISAVNAASLCGFNDWRLPSWQELHSIVAYPDQPLQFPLPAALDLSYFPNARSTSYWTATSSVLGGASARVIYFGGGGGIAQSKASAFAVRLVRGEVTP